jgi:S1-C subfamily serine protease
MIKLWAVILSTIFSGPTLASIPVKTADKAVNVSVLLRMKTRLEHGHRRYGGCSGTYVAPKLILTAAHCFEGNSVEYVWARDINQTVGYPVKLLVKWESHDLALLETPYPHAYAKIGRDPKVGEEVLNVGSPLFFEFVVSEGVIGALDFSAPGFGSKYLVTTAMINPGSSGGGAFNRYGELIGVNTMSIGVFGWNGISLAVSTADIRHFLGLFI